MEFYPPPTPLQWKKNKIPQFYVFIMFIITELDELDHSNHLCIFFLNNFFLVGFSPPADPSQPGWINPTIFIFC